MRRFFDWLLPRLGVACPVAILLGLLGYYVLLPELIWMGYRDAIALHRLAAPDIDEGAGSTDFEYLVMSYDCAEGDIVIDGEAPEARYWQLGIYDTMMRAVDGGHVNHQTARVGEDGSFTLRIASEADSDPNTLDCSAAHRGILMYRILAPRGDVEVPEVRVE